MDLSASKRCALVVVLAVGCGGATLPSTDQDAGPSDSGSPTATSPTATDTALPPPPPPTGTVIDASVPPPVLDASASICVHDPDCNEDPKVSALWGQCFHGVCICGSTFHVQPSGKCAPTDPPPCSDQAATCRQNPAKCQAGEIEGDFGENMSCGDFVQALCCFGSCKSPIDLVCCGASTTPHEPICVNGWKTCGSSAPSPKLRGGDCP